MSFTRSHYDTCAHEQYLSETVGTGIYMLGTPRNSCEPCIASANPYIRLQSQGASVSKDSSLIDVDSELLGITRNLSQCPERKYMPGVNAAGLCGSEAGCTQKGCNGKFCVNHQKKTNNVRVENCFPKTEDTKLSNPPCTLRGTGWNRWEYLERNPQERVEIPYDHQIDTKLLSKDNHRPCVVAPQDQFVGHPVAESDDIQVDRQYNFPRVPVGPPSVSWQRLDVISRY